MAIITFQPALFDLAYNNPFFEDTNIVSADILIMRDTLYSATIAVPAVVLGVVALWAYLAVQRRDDL